MSKCWVGSVLVLAMTKAIRSLLPIVELLNKTSAFVLLVKWSVQKLYRNKVKIFFSVGICSKIARMACLEKKISWTLWARHHLVGDQHKEMIEVLENLRSVIHRRKCHCWVKSNDVPSVRRRQYVFDLKYEILQRQFFLLKTESKSSRWSFMGIER